MLSGSKLDAEQACDAAVTAGGSGSDVKFQHQLQNGCACHVQVNCDCAAAVFELLTRAIGMLILDTRPDRIITSCRNCHP